MDLLREKEDVMPADGVGGLLSDDYTWNTRKTGQYPVACRTWPEELSRTWEKQGPLTGSQVLETSA